MRERLKLTQTTGLITKEVKYGDTGRIVTVITEDMGKISAITSKFRGGKGKYIPSLQLFSYSRLVLFKGSEKGLYHINEADIIEPFKKIREDFLGVCYASYFGEVANRVTVENETDPEFLRLLLNTFYALSKGEDYEKIKTVFEWRCAAAEGYAPQLEGCAECKSEEEAYLDIERGVTLCEHCGKSVLNAAKMNRGTLDAIKYICAAPSAKMLAFDCSDKMIEYLSALSELYLMLHLDCEFKTLEYLKKIKTPLI